MKCTLVYTDLDGTLLDHDTYRFDDAEATLERLKEGGVPIILCSSKTRAEIEALCRKMALNDPFISENGGAVFVPEALSGLQTAGWKRKGIYRVMELGTPHEILMETYYQIKAAGGFQMVGFSEMAPEEVARHTGLSVEEARLAAQRDYSEPFMFHEKGNRVRQLEAEIARRGLRVTMGGRFFHLMGGNDKGKAVEQLTLAYAQSLPGRKISTIGLGDGPNDIPMLRCVDQPVIIRKKTGEWLAFDNRQEAYFTDKPGPGGWAEAIQALCFDA